jgi:hypothetical protein
MKIETFETTLKQTIYLILPFSEITIIDGVSIGQRFILIDYFYKGSKYVTKLEYDSRKLELPYTDISEKILDMLVMKLHKEIDKLVVFGVE